MDLTGKTASACGPSAGVLLAEDAGDGLTRVNMGHPMTAWDEVPLARAMDTLHLPIEGDPVATGMGNPHCTFFVDGCDGGGPAAFGALHEHHPLFPERTNVEVVQVLSPDAIRLRIWERGTGVTLASGSCSCAAAVAAARRGLTGRRGRGACGRRRAGGRLARRWRLDDRAHGACLRRGADVAFLAGVAE
jgi:diaminopimelate epimerase